MPRRRVIYSYSSTLERIYGKNTGLFFEGSYDPLSVSLPTLKELRRPYLYIYAHSNELEEVGIISLTGVKVEHNPDMEMLFGVSSRIFSRTIVLKAHPHPETIHLHTLYRLKLTRVLGAE